MFTITIATLFLPLLTLEAGKQYEQFAKSYQEVLEGKRWGVVCEPGTGVDDLILSYRSYLRHSDYPSAVICAKMILALDSSSIEDSYAPYIHAITSRISTLDGRNRTYVTINEIRRKNAGDCPTAEVQGTSWYVQVGEECLVLLIDTGATVSMVTKQAANALHLPEPKEGFSQPVEVSVGSVTINNPLVGVLTEDQADNLSSVGIDGLIGLHSMVDGVITRDEYGFLAFAPRDAAPVPAGGREVAMQYDGVTLQTAKNDSNMHCVVGSGASISIIPRGMILEGSPSNSSRIRLVGVDGSRYFDKIDRAALKLGDYVYELDKVATTDGEECVIGLDFLLKYLGYLDIRTANMILEAED